LVREPARLSRESSDDEQLGKLGVLDFDEGESDAAVRRVPADASLSCTPSAT
jgi:hypothetical protein